MVDKIIDRMICSVVEHQENIIMAKVQEIGGEKYTDITIDKNKVLAAFRNATPKEPLGDLHSVPHYRCPSCNISVKTYFDSPQMPYCSWCGQKLRWNGVCHMGVT